MELVFTFADLLAIAITLYLLLSQRGKHLRWQVKCLIFSMLVCLIAALWCVIYGPDFWVLIQAGALIVVATITGILSSPKKGSTRWASVGGRYCRDLAVTSGADDSV